jgi:hypothetical protein
MTSIVVDPASESTELEAAPNPGSTDERSELPEKYRGKSVEDLVDMHRNAEAEIGRARNEIGSVRRLADELIGIRRAEMERANPPTAPKPVTANDLLDNPEETLVQVARRVADERMQDVNRRTQVLESELAVSRFEKKHPGFQATMAQADFADFVRNSEYRQRLAVQASQGDYVAADELFSLYGERQPTPPPQPSGGVAEARRAATAKPGGSSAAGVVASNDGKTRFSRTELLEMRMKRPDEFDRRQEEILDAYRDGRVR